MALAVVGLALVACQWRPDVLAALTLIPAWCWPIAGLLTAVPVARVRRLRELTLLVFVWLVFSFAIVEEVTSTARGALEAVSPRRLPDAVRPIRVVSLNCANSRACLGDLQRVAPDIALLQEAPGAEQLAEIARKLFGEPGSFLAGGDTAILARGRIEPLFVNRGAHFVAGVVHLKNGPHFTCVSLRLTPPPARLDFWTPAFWTDHRDLRQTHRQELQQIKSRIDHTWLAHPLLIGGDFNCVPLDRACDELRPQFYDTFTSHGRGWGATGTNDWPLFRVDQIWTNRRADFCRSNVVKTASSDHRMVVYEIVHPH